MDSTKTWYLNISVLLDGKRLSKAIFKSGKLTWISVVEVKNGGAWAFIIFLCQIHRCNGRWHIGCHSVMPRIRTGGWIPWVVINVLRTYRLGRVLAIPLLVIILNWMVEIHSLLYCSESRVKCWCGPCTAVKPLLVIILIHIFWLIICNGWRRLWPVLITHMCCMVELNWWIIRLGVRSW